MTMSSREIAEITGKRHADVLRDIDRLLESLNADLRLGYKSTTYKDSTGKINRQFDMDHDSVFCLIAGYDSNTRMLIIKRWQQLESNFQQTMMPTNRELAIRQLKSEFEVGNMFGCPEHIIQQEAVKQVRKDTGVDFSEMLKHSPAQQNILPQEIMLEPTELGAQLGVGSGRAMNQLLASWGLQKRENYEWIPTEKGSAYCIKHAWVKGNKEGYNLKWSLNKIKTLVVDDDSGDWEEVKPEPK
jgi:phage regulator Rha-like protein